MSASSLIFAAVISVRMHPGTSIGFFLLADSFRNGTVTKGNYAHFSHEALSIEPSPVLCRHMVVLDDSRSDRLLLAMEDVRRDSTGCDQDFNDAVFYLTSNPVKAIQDPAIPQLQTNAGSQSCATVCIPVRIARRK